MAGENERTLLLDGDVLAFRVASAVQKVEEDRFGYIRPFANKVEAEAGLDNLIMGLMDGLKATHMRVILSDPETNWRMEVMPEYKHNRDYSIVSRPLLLNYAKQYLRARHGAEHWMGLEADDVLGILGTEPATYPGTKIIVGNDKDFKQIPGFHHKLGDRDGSGKLRITTVTADEAIKYHMQQTLSGDKVDGYGGCPGIGPTGAEQIIANPTVLTRGDGKITRGPRKGEQTDKWTAEPTADLWACVVTHYMKAGQGEKEALRNARVSQILHYGDYDTQTGKVKLWLPPGRH